MIDLTNEKVMSFKDAAEWLPRRGRGRKVAVTTLWRWAKHGVNGVRLEIARIGRAPVTSREALQRFSDSLAGTDAGGPNPGRSATARQSTRNDRAAAAELNDHGWL